MSKRYAGNQQHSDRKKARLVVTLSSQNFPSSQFANYREPEPDKWGDEDDDEILLLASQACEDACSDISNIASCSSLDYSKCMQPRTTSTQYEPTASTSNAAFTFKEPSNNRSNIISTQLKNKCNTIASPLPGTSAKNMGHANERFNYCDDIVISSKGQDPNFIYRQVLQLQEENAKLKSENGKLLEKCVTKEGEASILRTQLKSCHVAVDNARIEKIKAQERVETEWNQKLTAAINEMADLRTQLDFKNLEIISVKEKCKKLESNKLRLTQVTVGNQDISSSHRNNSNMNSHDSFSQLRKVKMTSNGIQTDDKADFLKLNKMCYQENPKLVTILPFVTENPWQQQHSILDYNEKLQKDSDFSQNNCKIFSTFHRVPATPTPSKDITKSKVNLSDIYEDLTFIAVGKGDFESLQKKYFNLFNALYTVLQEVQCELEAILKQVINAFEKEMDERYLEVTSTFTMVSREDLFKSSALYKDEQAILTRRLTAVAAYTIETQESFQMLQQYEEKYCNNGGQATFVDSINRICHLLDSAPCAVLYSGFLLSLVILLENYFQNMPSSETKIIEVSKLILSSRPMPFVSSNLLVVIRRLSKLENFLPGFCPGSNLSNLKADYDQGVLLYTKDSCYLQILFKQIEASMQCVETQKLKDEALSTTSNLIAIFRNAFNGRILECQETKCCCQLVLIQVIVYSLRICALMLKNLDNFENNRYHRDLLSVCRSGVQLLHQCALPDVEFFSLLAHNEGHLVDLCLILKEFDHSEIYDYMLFELTSVYQAPPEEAPSSYYTRPWLKSFESFSLSDSI